MNMKMTISEQNKKVITCALLGHQWRAHPDDMSQVCERCNEVKKEV